MQRLVMLALAAALAVPAAAQEAPRPRDREREFPREFFFSYGPGDIRVGFQRGRLGVLVDLTADPARDSVGARVAGVTPGGAADRAGVRSGDLIVRLNGTRLVDSRPSDRQRGEGGDRSAPGLRLIELASQLSGGDTVRLELRRDSRPLNVTVVAGEGDWDRAFSLRGGVLGRLDSFTLPRLEGLVPFMRAGASLADLELVRLNPGLAEYFGTGEGLLVVEPPGDSGLGLRAGDVILRIGGRQPTSPAHALRILRSYEPGESVGFEIMRQRRRITVTGRMSDERQWRTIRNRYEAPPSPPAPPPAPPPPSPYWWTVTLTRQVDI